MTTAARPTWDTAKGGSGKGENDLSKLSKHYSARDLPSHTKLKYRKEGQTAPSDVRSKDFRHDLEEKERSKDKRKKESSSTYRKSKADSALFLDVDDAISESDSDPGSDEDDTAELMRQLEKIKRERAEEKAKKEAEKRIEEERIRREQILRGNPLLNPTDKSSASGNFAVKRRWDDDVVFKNCAKEPEKRKDFVNDMLRTDFHKRFMEKYIK